MGIVSIHPVSIAITIANVLILFLILKKFLFAPVDRILEARAMIARKGIYCEHTTAANYAAYLEYCRLYGPAHDCLIPMCGAGLKSDH